MFDVHPQKRGVRCFLRMKSPEIEAAHHVLWSGGNVFAGGEAGGVHLM